MSLLFLIFFNWFILPSFSLWAIDEPFNRKLHKPLSLDEKNFVYKSKYENIVSGEIEVQYQGCAALNTGFLIPNTTRFINEFEWKCVQTPENGRLSFEPISCLKSDFSTMAPGDSFVTRNGSIRQSCDFANGGLRKVTEYVPGCYHNGRIYEVDREWEEENPGGETSLLNVTMTCKRGKSGYFEKQVAGCVLYVKQDNTEIAEDSENIVYKYIHHMQLNEVVVSYAGNKIDKKQKCVETETGRVGLIEVTEEDMACKHKNITIPYSKTYVDREMGAVLACIGRNQIVKNDCIVNGKTYPISNSPRRLSNGCAFYCSYQKLIYKCDEQIPGFAVLKRS